MMTAGWTQVGGHSYGLGLVCVLLSWATLGFSQEMAQHQPDIVFPQTEVSFGVAGRGEAISSTFVYENRGTADLVVEAVKPACGQRVTEAGARRVRPGERSALTVAVTLGNHVGSQRFPVLVQSNDPDAPEVALVVSGTVATGVAAMPESLSFGKLPQGGKAQQSVRLRDLDRSALTAKVLALSGRLLRATLRPAESDPQHQWNLTVSVDAEQAPLGPFAEVVTVELAQAGRASKRLDIPVTGWVVPASAADEAHQPAFRGTLAFSANLAGNWDLFVWTGGTASPKAVTATPYDEKWPTLVAAQGLVAFTTTEGLPVVANLSSGDQRTLEIPDRPGKWDTCSVSPDARSLACAYFAPTAADKSALAIVDLETGQARPVVDQFGPQFFPAWSPDGKQIAYAYAHCSSACGRILQEIWVADASGGNARQLVMTNAHCLRPAWSPDGKQLAFAADIEGNFDLWRYDRVSEQITRLTDYPGLDESPAFAPDGKQVAFISNRGGRKGLWIKDLNSGEEREIKPFGDTPVEIKDLAWGWPEQQNKGE